MDWPDATTFGELPLRERIVSLAASHPDCRVFISREGAFQVGWKGYKLPLATVRQLIEAGWLRYAGSATGNAPAGSYFTAHR